MRKLVIGLALLAACAGGAEEKKGTPEVKPEKIESKLADAPPASAVDFSVLGLPFASLESLGARIDAARRNADPVSLASAAAELSVAERVSGKKAKLAAETLAGEARDLAALRASSKEMKAVALLLGETLGKGLLARAEKRAKEEEADEKTRGIAGSLAVHNRTRYSLRIFINGRYAGQVNANTSLRFHVPPHRGSTHLAARGGFVLARHHHVSAHTPHYDWVITR